MFKFFNCILLLYLYVSLHPFHEQFLHLREMLFSQGNEFAFEISWDQCLFFYLIFSRFVIAHWTKSNWQQFITVQIPMPIFTVCKRTAYDIANSVYCLKNVFNVCSPCHFFNKNRCHSFIPQSFVHTQEINFDSTNMVSFDIHNSRCAWYETFEFVFVLECDMVVFVLSGCA